MSGLNSFTSKSSLARIGFPKAMKNMRVMVMGQTAVGKTGKFDYGYLKCIASFHNFFHHTHEWVISEIRLLSCLCDLSLQARNSNPDFTKIKMKLNHVQHTNGPLWLSPTLSSLTSDSIKSRMFAMERVCDVSGSNVKVNDAKRENLKPGV